MDADKAVAISTEENGKKGGHQLKKGFVLDKGLYFTL